MSILDDIKQIITNSKSDDDIVKALANDNRWPLLYHLSTIRGNIVESMRLDKSMDVLEVNAECGALTGKISKKCKSLTSLECSKEELEINELRNKAENITFKVADIDEIEGQFDCIISVGEKNVSHLLEVSKKLLKKDGYLYFACHNRYSMGFFAGRHDDKTGKVFASIESNDTYSLSKKEIIGLVEQSGYKKYYFYYPMPDYLVPSVIFSDDYLPKKGEIRNVMDSFDLPRDIFFNEEKAFDIAIQTGDFITFSSSFLVEVKKDGE